MHAGLKEAPRIGVIGNVSRDQVTYPDGRAAIVYGPLFHGRSRLTAADAASLARTVAARGGTLIHLTARPDAIIARLRSRDGRAPGPDDIRAIIDGYHTAFALLAGTAPVVTADTTSAGAGPESRS